LTREDGDLIRRAKTGDRSALADLLRAWDRPVMAVAFRILADREDAADVRQLAFVRVCESIGRFDEQARFSTWLYRIVVNLCRDRIRQSRRRTQAMQRVNSIAERADGRSTGNYAAADKSAVAAVVADAVADLPEDQREAIVLKHFAGLSFAEMAATLDVPVSTLKSRVMRALDGLRLRLRDAGSLLDDQGAAK